MDFLTRFQNTSTRSRTNRSCSSRELTPGLDKEEVAAAVAVGVMGEGAKEGFGSTVPSAERLKQRNSAFANESVSNASFSIPVVSS